jgi:hypothetical protein
VTTNDTIYDTEVCQDCAMLIANGELPEDNPDFKLSPRWDGYQVVLNCDEDGCEGFSWSPCDGCDSRLGGDRHKAAAWLL